MPLKYRVLPLCTKERNDASFWNSPMNVCCFLCGENPMWWSAKYASSSSKDVNHVNPHPYPLICELDSVNKLIDVGQVVCRTCLKNSPIWCRRLHYGQMLTMWNSEYIDDIMKEESLLSQISRPQIEELSATSHTFDNLPSCDDETLIGEVDKLLQVPPLLALSKFDGPLEWDVYNDSACVWTHPTSQNPHEIRVYHKNDPVYSQNFTDTGKCCWGCLQPLGYDGAVPTWYDSDHVQGLFHPNGRCALRYLLEYDGDRATVRASKSKDLWVRDFGMSLKDRKMLKEAPDRRLLRAFDGILTLEEYLTERNILYVREAWMMNYPYYMRIDGVSNLEEIQYVDASTHELQPFDKNLAKQINRVWHPLVIKNTTTRWRISHSLLTIEYPDHIAIELLESSTIMSGHDMNDEQLNDDGQLDEVDDALADSDVDDLDAPASKRRKKRRQQGCPTVAGDEDDEDVNNDE